MKTYTLRRGDTWNPTIELFADKEKTIPFDATGYTGKCYIKPELEEESTPTVTLDISWTDQPNGIGTVSLTYADSLKLRIHEFIYEFKIYTAANAIRKTVEQGILKVVEVLEKD